MEIKNKTKIKQKTTLYLKDLEEGDCFIFTDRDWICFKTEEGFVTLDDGTTFSISDNTCIFKDTPVKRIIAFLNIEGVID